MSNAKYNADELIKAVLSDNLEYIQEYYRAGQDLNVLCHYNGQDVTPLMIATGQALDMLQAYGAKSKFDNVSGRYVAQYNDRWFFTDGALRAIKITENKRGKTTESYRMYTKNKFYGAMQPYDYSVKINEYGAVFDEGWTDEYTWCDWRTTINNDGNGRSWYLTGRGTQCMLCSSKGEVRHLDVGRTVGLWTADGTVEFYNDRGRCIERLKYTEPQILTRREYFDAAGKPVGRYEFSGQKYIKHKLAYIDHPKITIQIPSESMRFIDEHGEIRYESKNGDIYKYEDDGSYVVYEQPTSFDMQRNGFEHIVCASARVYDAKNRLVRMYADINDQATFEYWGDTTQIKQKTIRSKTIKPVLAPDTKKTKDANFVVEDTVEYDAAGNVIYSENRVYPMSYNGIKRTERASERKRQTFYRGTQIVQHERAYIDENQVSYKHFNPDGQENTKAYTDLKQLARKRITKRKNHQPGQKLVSDFEKKVADFISTKLK